MHIIKKIASFILIMLLIASIGGGIFVYGTVQEISGLVKIDKIKKISAPKIFSLESDGLVDRAQLENYLIYQSKESKKLDDLIEEGVINVNKNQLTLKENLELSTILKNDCDVIFCLQYKKSFDDIPSGFWKFLIGTEDNRFLEHNGVDVISILRAAIVDLKEMKFVQGGSTITQQLVKNLFLSSQRTIKRKLKEVIYSIYLENHTTKEEIISTYLNQMFWGAFSGIRLKGFYSASLFYFGKKAKDLTDFEITILVSMLKGPAYYNPLKGFEKLRKRVDYIFSNLKKRDYVLVSENPWSTSQWKSWVKDLEKRNKNLVLNTIWRMSERSNSLNSYEKYVLINEALKRKEQISEANKQDVSIKILIRDIKCRDCEDFIFYSSPEKDLDESIFSIKHQVGSIFKPIVYNAFTSDLLDWNDMVSLKPITLDLISGKWTPRDHGKMDGEISISMALKKSRNIPLIRLAQEHGFDWLEEKLEPYINFPNKPLKEFPAQLLGALELSIGAIADTYENFIHDVCSKINEGDLGLEKSVIGVLSNPKETTLRSRVKFPLNSHKFFGKTGTTNNAFDNWFVAFDGQKLFVIWIGSELREKTGKLVLAGASSSFLVFQDYYLKRGLRFSELQCNFQQLTI